MIRHGKPTAAQVSHPFYPSRAGSLSSFQSLLDRSAVGTTDVCSAKSLCSGSEGEGLKVACQQRDQREKGGYDQQK